MYDGPAPASQRRRFYPHYHFHIEFYPPLRSANRLKYLAGSETGAGMFINDTLAEEKARELRRCLSRHPHLRKDHHDQRP